MNSKLFEPPQPRDGLLGGWDKFIGPGATAAELFLQLVSAVGIGSSCFFVFRAANPDSSIYMNALVLLFGIDLIGGVVTNATTAAKRWYHRSSQTFSHHMMFIAVHALQIGLVSFYFAKDPWIYFGLVYGILMVSSVIVLTVPLYLQRPTAMALAAASVPFSMSGFLPATPGLEWFVPLLYLKLLVSHLTTETPFPPQTKKMD